MSPPLVVAFALAGRVDIDFQKEPLGTDKKRQAGIPEGHLAQLRGNCGSRRQIPQPGGLPGTLHHHAGQEPALGRRPRPPPVPSSSGMKTPPTSRTRPSSAASTDRPARWRTLQTPGPGHLWRLRNHGPHLPPEPSGNRSRRSVPAIHGRLPNDFHSFGSRRGNDRVMTRGTFANVRIKNLMVDGTEGGYTLYFGNRKSRPRTRTSPASTGSPPSFTMPPHGLRP